MTTEKQPERRISGRRGEVRDTDRRRTPGWKALWNSVLDGRLFTPGKSDDDSTKK